MPISEFLKDLLMAILVGGVIYYAAEKVSMPLALGIIGYLIIVNKDY